MKKYIFGLMSASLIFTLGCSGGGNSIGSPGGKQEEAPPVDPCSEVVLSWTAPTHNVDGSVLTDLAGYNIYMGFQSGVYSDQMEINDPTLLTYTLTGLEFGRQYYFVMTAVNAQGEESSYSGQATKLTDTCPDFMSFSQPTAHH